MQKKKPKQKTPARTSSKEDLALAVGLLTEMLDLADSLLAYDSQLRVDVKAFIACHQ